MRIRAVAGDVDVESVRVGGTGLVTRFSCPLTLLMRWARLHTRNHPCLIKCMQLSAMLTNEPDDMADIM